MRFTKPPLIELIAELRWGVPAIALPSSVQITSVGGGASSKHEEFFMRFGSKVAGDGFDRFERVSPPGFPLLPFQPVYRYRYSGSDKGTSLYQLGVGLFTANITPPYRSWEQFRPIVEKGVNLLLEAQPESKALNAFGSASLRYIDAFRSELTGGVSAIDFLRDTLGFSVDVPKVVKSLAKTGAVPKPALQFQVELENALVLQLQAGEGQVDGEAAVIMDTSVSTTTELGATVADAMAAFDSAHDVIRAAFIGMTEKIASRMEPLQD